MSQLTGIPDWICMVHSQAGYRGDGGCSKCVGEKTAKEEVQQLRDRIERQGIEIAGLQVAYDLQEANQDKELAEKDARILALEGTIDQLRLQIQEREERDL